MHFYNRKLCFTALLCLALSSHSATAANPQISSHRYSQALVDKIASSLVISLSAGPVWDNAGNAQTLTRTPGIDKTYTTNGSGSFSTPVGVTLNG